MITHFEDILYCVHIIFFLGIIITGGMNVKNYSSRHESVRATVEVETYLS